MRAVVSRVDGAVCRVDGEIAGKIDCGILVVAGFSVDDTEADVIKTALKIGKLRIFADNDGKINKSASDIGGSALVISNFTLYGRVRHSHRPDFTRSCPAERAKSYYELFKKELSAHMPVQSGVFGSHMHIEAQNDGPVTLIIDSCDL
ncbi:MAG: D-aminoacyl-tRNA deacylase [Eubacteriales bacterium]|nr:D-aminoacyl-tRNA deacylase [Eubacteriales bacterium]